MSDQSFPYPLQGHWSYRLRDLILAGAGLLLLWPLMLVIALLLACTQPRILFFQPRPGRGERHFRLVKFSTLYDRRPGDPTTGAQRHRLTPVGRYLRRWSLDELPQLWNVVKGEMSLIGPRPLLVDYLPLYTEAERLRHAVRPGITGWAQIHGRNKLAFKERFVYDCWYVAHQSHRLDVQILWRTVAKVWRKEGVYADQNSSSPRFDGTN